MSSIRIQYVSKNALRGIVMREQQQQKNKMTWTLVINHLKTNSFC